MTDNLSICVYIHMSIVVITKNLAATVKHAFGFQNKQLLKWHSVFPASPCSL